VVTGHGERAHTVFPHVCDEGGEIAGISPAAVDAAEPIAHPRDKSCGGVAAVGCSRKKRGQIGSDLSLGREVIGYRGGLCLFPRSDCGGVNDRLRGRRFGE